MSDFSLLAQEAEGRGLGEPEWMPAPEEVARARAQMERQGIVRALTRGMAAAPAIAPGEIPWAWLIGAGLWLLIWPGVIALRLAASQLAWLPAWLSLLLAAVHMLALAAPVWVSQRTGGLDDIRRRFGKVQTVAQMLALEPAEFEAWTGMLFTLMGFQVTNTQLVADHGIDLEVRGRQARYGLVQCKRYRGTVGEPTVRDLYGTLIHENADVGWLATTGGVSRQARDWAAGKPLHLWDGQELVALARQYR
jgi:hypothetical protein